MVVGFCNTAVQVLVAWLTNRPKMFNNMSGSYGEVEQIHKSLCHSKCIGLLLLGIGTVCFKINVEYEKILAGGGSHYNPFSVHIEVYSTIVSGA